MSAKFECRKFSPNMFNKSKCQHCFAAKDLHSAEALENNRASRKVSKCGYLFVAPDWDFSNQIYRTKRWQRRWFVLYDDGELTYAVDEHPDTVPQCAVDMGKVLEVSDAEEVTGNKFSIAITAPDKVHFVKGTCKEESKWWFDVLSVFTRFVKGRQRRNATFPGIKGASVPPTSGTRDTVIRSRFLSCRTDAFEEDPAVSAVTAPDGNGSPLSSPPLPRLVPASPASGRDLGTAVAVAESPPYEARDVIIQQKGQANDCALTLILAENGLGGQRRTPRRVQRRRSPEESPPERSKSAGPTSPVERDRNEVNRGNRYAGPLYLRISDVPKVKRYESLDLIHLDQDGPLSPKGRNVSESHDDGEENLETGRKEDDLDGPKVVSWTEKAPPRTSDARLPENTFKEHTVRGDPDGCGLDHAVKYNIPEIRVDNTPDDTLFIKKGWLMRKEESKDWLKRWFVLCGPTLAQHADPAAETTNAPEVTVNMGLALQVRDTEVARNYGIEITLCDGSTHLLSALTAGLRAGWVQALRNAALQRNGNVTVSPSAIKDNVGRVVAENVPVRRTVLGSDQKSVMATTEESSSRALPSSPPLNRTAISRVKERARHKGVLRPVAKVSRDTATSSPEDPPGYISVEGRTSNGLRTRNPNRRHTLPARTGPGWDPGVDADMWTTSDLLSNLGPSSNNNNNAELLRKWTRAIESRHGIAETPGARRPSPETQTDAGKPDGRGEGGEKRKTAKVLGRLKSLSDLTADCGHQAEPRTREEWAGRCDELKRKLEAAIREIRGLKAELKKSHDNTDDLELRCFRLESNGEESDKRHRDEVALLSLRVQDLASKLASADRQLRQLTAVKRPRSLKGRESVSVSRELEMKVEDLESRLASVEGNAGGEGGGIREGKGEVRLARSSSFTSVTESLAIHSKLRDMDARLSRAANRIRCGVEKLPPEGPETRPDRRRPSLIATIARLRNLTVAGNLGAEEGFVRETRVLREFLIRGEDEDDAEETARLSASLRRSLSWLVRPDEGDAAPPPSPLSAFWDMETEEDREELAGGDATAASARLSLSTDKLLERAEEVIAANLGTVTKRDAVKILGYLQRGSQMTRAEVGAARLLLDCSAAKEVPEEEEERRKTAMNVVSRRAEERLRALREEKQRLPSPPASSAEVARTVSAERLAGVMVGKALLAAQTRSLVIRDAEKTIGVVEEEDALVVAEMKAPQRSVLASLLTVGLEGSDAGKGPGTCRRCEVLAERFADVTRRQEEEMRKLREEEDENNKKNEEEEEGPSVAAFKEEEQRALVSRLEEEVANLRDQLRSMVEDYEQHVTALKETFEQELTRRSEVRVGAVSVHQKYQTEMEQLKSLCEKGMAAIDHSHRRILVGLEEKHRREMEHVRAEKEQALAEETQATLAALDAMRKAHETELQREVAKFKEEYLSKMHASSDLEALRREHEEEMESIKREILFLSRKYSMKCLDSASLEEQVELQGRQIKEANELIFDVTARNKQLRVHLKQNIRELQNLTKNMENSGHKQSVQELQLQLQLKENQLVEKGEQMADLERQLIEAKNHHRALEQQCQALDVSLRANGRALGDEVNGLKARLEQVILASLATAEGWSGQTSQEKDRTQRTSFSLAEPKSKRSPVLPGTRIRETITQRSPSSAIAKRELTGTDRSSSPAARMAGVVASRKRLFEDTTDVHRS